MKMQPINPKPDAEPDIIPLKGLRALHPPAFEWLLRRFEDPLYRFFFYSHGDSELARDQSAETFADLVTAFPKMRGDESQVRAFVFGVARNVMRRGWRVRPMPLCSEPSDLESVPDARRGTFEQVAERDAFRKAIELIRSFDEPMRQVMLLRFVEELKHEEIATALAIPVNTVKSIVRRGCAKIRERLSDKAESADTGTR